MSLLFDRSASIIVGNNDFSLSVGKIRIVFSVEKDISESQNTIKLEAYNLSDVTRNKIEDQDSEIILNVGYGGPKGEELLFRGNITRSHTIFSNPNIVTTIEAGDGMAALREARSNISNSEGVGVTTILKKLGSDLGVAVKEITAEIKESFSNGFSFIGPTKDALDKITDSFGLEWSIQDGELQINKIEKTIKDLSVLLNKNTGMISSPEPVQNDGQILKSVRSKQTRFVIKSLLNPKIRPGGTVEIESKNVEGTFKVKAVKHSGDTHGDEWTSVAEVIQI